MRTTGREIPRLSGYPGGPVRERHSTEPWTRHPGFGSLTSQSSLRPRQSQKHRPCSTSSGFGQVPDMYLHTKNWTARRCRARNSSYVCGTRVRPDASPRTGAVGVGRAYSRWFTHIDIFPPGTYRVGYFKAKNRTVPVLLWDWYLLCVLQALPCLHSVSFSSPQAFLTPVEPLEWPTGDF